MCADAIALPGNFLYQRYFVTRLKNRMRRKAKLFPGKFNLEPMARVRTIRDFDDVITATYCGFRGASDYYERSSALRVAADIRVPTLILTAQGDPFIPYASFSDPALASNAHIEVVAPRHGGHCAFISRHKGDARFWAEARVMEFLESVHNLSKSALKGGLSSTGHQGAKAIVFQDPGMSRRPISLKREVNSRPTNRFQFYETACSKQASRCGMDVRSRPGPQDAAIPI